jgi:hypothetical protein
MVHNVYELRMNGVIFLIKGLQAAVNANHKNERCSLLMVAHMKKMLNKQKQIYSGPKYSTSHSHRNTQ